MLKAREIAPDDDHVHALGVLDDEVAHRLAAVVDDTKADLLVVRAAQLRGGYHEAQTVVGDREAAYRICLAVGAMRGGDVRARPGRDSCLLI